MKKVMVVGAGIMGSGIAQVCIEHGLETILTDVSEEVAEKGKEKIYHFLQRKIEKGRMTQEERDQAVVLLKSSGDYQDGIDADIVIEAATENVGIKLQIFKKLDEIVKENTIYIYYTGNVRHTDKEYDYITDGREQNTILMTSEDGFHFSKKRLLMQNTDYPSDLSLHVRDPQVFCENGKYYMVQGARDLEARGSALLFESENLIDWSYRLRLETEETFGYMWECPNYLSVDGRQFLIVCPQKMKQEKNRYIKENLCGYFPLQYDFLGEDYQIGAFATLDRGFDFYAPQVFKDEAGRWILLGWMSTPDASYDCEVTMEHGWVHAMTVPRELYVNQKGRLCQRPLEELQRMRTEGLTENFQTGSDFHKTVSACFEWKLTMDKPAEAFELLIRKSAVLSYKDNVLCLDLTRCGAGRKTTEVLLSEVYELQILSDTSSLEIFVNGGEETFTTRIYDSMKGLQVAVKKMQGSGKLELYHLTV